MKRKPATEAKIVRIAGNLEDWLRDFANRNLADYKGRIRGVCVHLDIEDGPEFSFARVYQRWDSRHHLQGVLMTTVTRLANEFDEHGE